MKTPVLVRIVVMMGSCALLLNQSFAQTVDPYSAQDVAAQGLSPWYSVASPTSSHLLALDIVSTNDIWAVGGEFGSTGTGTMVHWDGSSWQTISIPTTQILRSISMVSTNDGWAVGGFDTSNILRWNGSTWISVPSPSSLWLAAVSVLSANNVWAIGGGGLIAHWDGNSWSSIPSPTGESLWAIEMLGTSNGWAVGDGVILHWDGNSWQTVPNPLQGSRSHLTSIAMLSATDGWIVGGKLVQGSNILYGAALHWNGINWSEVALPTEDFVSSIAAVSSRDLWATGANFLFLHWDGSSWDYTRGTGIGNSIAMISATDGWAVGINGSIIHYSGNTIYGRITDTNNNALTDVIISDGAGHAATTNNLGYYGLYRLAPGTYTLTPSKSGYSFMPTSRTIRVPPITGEGLFTGIAGSVLGENAVRKILTLPFPSTANAINADGSPHQGWCYNFIVGDPTPYSVTPNPSNPSGICASVDSRLNHFAIDFMNRTATSFDVLAAAEGNAETVVTCDDKNNCTSTWGNYVHIAHPNGWHMVYAHLDTDAFKNKYGKLKNGWVNRGELIGIAGKSGDAHNTIHLHFELSSSWGSQQASTRIDPYGVYGTSEFYGYNVPVNRVTYYPNSRSAWREDPPSFADHVSQFQPSTGASLLLTLDRSPIKSESATLNVGGTSSGNLSTNQFLQFLTFILNWPGSTLRLTVYDPNGNLYTTRTSSTPPIIMEIPNAMPGTWSYSVTAVDIPYDGYLYTLDVGQQGATIDVGNPTPKPPRQEDNYEPDDGMGFAHTITGKELHNFCGPKDEDWVKFTAKAGWTYHIKADPPANFPTEPRLELYVNGSVVAQNDHYFGNIAEIWWWNNGGDQTVYVRATELQGRGDCGSSTYTLSVEGTQGKP